MSRSLIISLFALAFCLTVANSASAACFREGCKVQVKISSAQKRMQVFVEGELLVSEDVVLGRRTELVPFRYDRPVNGRIYGENHQVRINGAMEAAPYAVYVMGGTLIYGEVNSRSRVFNGIGTSLKTARMIRDLALQSGPENVWVTIDAHDLE